MDVDGEFLKGAILYIIIYYIFIYIYIYCNHIYVYIYLSILYGKHIYIYDVVCCETLAELVDDELFRQVSRDWLQRCFRVLGCAQDGWHQLYPPWQNYFHQCPLVVVLVILDPCTV